MSGFKLIDFACCFGHTVQWSLEPPTLGWRALKAFQRFNPKLLFFFLFFKLVSGSNAFTRAGTVTGGAYISPVSTTSSISGGQSKSTFSDAKASRITFSTLEADDTGAEGVSQSGIPLLGLPAEPLSSAPNPAVSRFLKVSLNKVNAAKHLKLPSEDHAASLYGEETTPAVPCDSSIPRLSPGFSAPCSGLASNSRKSEMQRGLQRAPGSAQGIGFFQKLANWMMHDPLSAEEERVRAFAEKVHKWNQGRHRHLHNTKLIIAMRHSESTYNVWRRESFTRLRFSGKAKICFLAWSFFFVFFSPYLIFCPNFSYVSDMLKRDWGEKDVPLSEEGLEQCKRANRMLSLFLSTVRNMEEESRLRGEEVEQPFCVDAFLVSPLTRALQTAANSMVGVGAKLHCGPNRHMPIVRQPKSIEEQGFIIWIVMDLLREKISTMGDIGLLKPDLTRRLIELRDQGQLEPSNFDFALLPDDFWWVPHTEDQLKKLVSNFIEASACSSCWSDALSTVASESEEKAQEAPLHLGSFGKHSLSAGEVALKDAVDVAQWPAREASAVLSRMAEWDRRNSNLPVYQTVPEETRSQLQLRAELLLRIFCQVEGVNTFFMVTHSLFLKVLTNTSKLGNAEFRAYMLECNSTPKLVPL